MEYVLRRHPSMKVNIPDVARRETEYVLFYEIVYNIKKYSIPHSMVRHHDQTPLKIVPCGKSTLTKKEKAPSLKRIFLLLLSLLLLTKGQ